MLGPEEAGVAIAAILIAGLVAMIFGVLIGALFLRWSVRILQGFSPGYGVSVLTVFVTSLAGIALAVILSFALAAAGMLDVTAIGAQPDMQALSSMMAAQMMLSVGNFVIGLLLTATFVHLLIRQPDGSRIGFGRAVLVALLYVMMMMVLVFVLAFLLAIVIGLGAGLAVAG